MTLPCLMSWLTTRLMVLAGTAKPIPELDNKFWENAVIKYPEKKKPITLRLDADVLVWFKSIGKGYQTRINAILRTFYESHKRNVP